MFIHVHVPIVAMVVSGIFLMSEAYAQDDSGHGAKDEIIAPVVVRRSAPEVTAETLRLKYELINDSPRDIWICESMDLDYVNFEVFVDSDGETLFVLRRLDVFCGIMTTPPEGRYVRLRAGQNRTELLSLSLPVYTRRILTDGGDFGESRDTTRLVLEVGYYDEDLLSRVRPNVYLNLRNEDLNRREEVLIPYEFMEGEKVLRLLVDNVRIPYIEDLQSVGAPDGVLGTRLDVEFKPSALPFLFPAVDDQALLNAMEQERLHSLTRATISDFRALNALIEELRMALDGAFICEDATASVTCYRQGDRIGTFVIDENASVLSATGQVFRYRDGLPSLRAAIPDVRSLDLRVSCAHNLYDLWCRLHSTNMPPDDSTSVLSENSAIAYPAPDQWCDGVLRPYQKWDRKGTGQSVRPFKCPAAGEGKCHYAMNPICEQWPIS